METHQNYNTHDKFNLKQLKSINRKGSLLWPSAQLAKALGYQDARHFKQAIKKAKLACANSNHSVSEHFHIITHKNAPQLGERKRNKLYLTAFACWLAVQNANPNKNIVALSQAELAHHFKMTLDINHSISSEDQSRLLLRHEIYQHNKELAKIAKQAGVIEPDDFSAFQNLGYKGLYGGFDQKEIHQKKNLNKSEKILDFMSSTELAANLFRATQTEEKLKRSNIREKLIAFQLHYDIAQKVRQTIKELGGTLPEDLPKPEKSIKAIEKIHARKLLNV